MIQVAGIWLVPDAVLGNQAKELNFLSCQTRQSFSSHGQGRACAIWQSLSGLSLVIY